MSEITPKKSLGQNFLGNEEAAQQIAELIDVENVLEIGPGLGALTKQLAGRIKKLTVVEIDNELSHILKKQLGKKIKIIQGDCLDQSFSDYNCIVGLLPYNISSKVIEKFIRSNAEKAVFVVQHEVAERMVAAPGTRDYSRLTILCQNNCECELIAVYPPEFFWPKPQVHSALITMKKKTPMELDQTLVNALFQHKNQKVKKALKHSRHILGLKTPANDSLLEKKVVQLTIEELAKLSA